MSTQVATQQEQSPQEVVRSQFDKMDGEIEKVLPEHVSLDKFKRVVLTAVGRSPDLMGADRKSLMAACLDAAQDGLIPDGREAALVVFNTKTKGPNGEEIWIKKAQYMPMIAGIYKKARNSGEISTLSAHLVHVHDEFEYWIDEAGPHLRHTPLLTGPRGDVMLVYSVCKLKDGSVDIETMTKAEVEEVRAVSKTSKWGPWNDWWGEMARKTVTRRHTKRLPVSSDLERLMRRDDSMYDLEQPPAVDAPPRPQRVEYQPDPPAQGEDFDKRFHDTMGDEIESASGGPDGQTPQGKAAAEQGRDGIGSDQAAGRPPTPAPEREGADSAGQPIGDGDYVGKEFGLPPAEPEDMAQKRLDWLKETSSKAQSHDALEKLIAKEGVQGALEKLPNAMLENWAAHIAGVREALDRLA